MRKTLSLRVTQASLNQTALDWPRNMANIYAAIDKAVLEGSDILALEELTLTGYEVNDDFQRTDNDRILAALEDVAAYAKAQDPNLIISIGHPWRLQMRDVPGQPETAFERTKNPLYDRLNLPYNVQTILSGGDIVAMTAKANLYNDGRGYEKRYFNEWSLAAANHAGGTYGTIDVALSDDGTRKVPFGRALVTVGDGKRSINLAQAICEEKWVASCYDGHPHDDSRYDQDNIIPSIARHLGGKDGLVILAADASPPAREKIDAHRYLNEMASRHADAFINTDGLGSSGSTFAQFGHRLIAQDGKTVSAGSRMNFARVATTTTTIRVAAAPADSAKKTHVRLKHNFAAKAAPLPAPDDSTWDTPKNPNRHYEEVIRYTAFWLYDYMRKAGTRGIMEALSGGADSAFNSLMVPVMVNIGMKELGVAGFCNEMNLPNTALILAAEKTGGVESAIDACVAEMLTGVYMGTNNSSSDTRNAAEFLIKGGVHPDTGEIVKGIGGKFINRNVQDLLDFYGAAYAVEDMTQMNPANKQVMIGDIAAYLNASPYTTTAQDRAGMAAALKARYPQIDDLVTAADGATYENIQARGRQVLINLFANKEGKMAVVNPNLDETRNGYTTPGGDLHSGAIGLNAHLPKAYQLGIMRYLYEHGVQGVMGPVRALGLILKNKPSAELLPRGADGTVVQNDEDALQRSFVQMDLISEFMLYQRTHTSQGDRRLNASEVFEQCQKHPAFGGVDENQLYNMVRFSYSRWAIAQHKIHQSPIGPTFGRNVDHQTSLRTPNINGQSKDELTLLGIELLWKWAERDGLGWSPADKTLLKRRAWQDEHFVKAFEREVRSNRMDRNFDLLPLYQSLQEKGWDRVFAPLPASHPVKVVHKLTPGTPGA